MSHADLPLRLNILALPNQQKVIVVMLAVVIFGTLLAIGFSTPGGLFFALALFLAGLALRQMLVRFERESSRLSMHLPSAEFTPLQAHLDYLGRERLMMKRVPHLAIAAVDCSPRVVATWKRQYVVMDAGQARRLQAMLAEPARAGAAEVILLHELHHLKHGDHLWIEYARTLLRSGVWLILWLALLLIGLVVLLTLVQRSFFLYATPDVIHTIAERYMPGQGDSAVVALFGSVEEYWRVAEEARNTDFGQVLFNVIFNTLPYILIGAVLFVSYWSRLLRLREVYADAGAAQGVGDATAVVKAIAAQLIGKGRVRSGWRLIAYAAAWLGSLRDWLFQLHPSPQQRVAFLDQPERVNGSPHAYGAFIGGYLLGLTLLAYSTAALVFVGDWPMHLPVATTVPLLGIYLLTPLVLGQPAMRPLLTALAIVVGLYGGVILLTLASMLVLVLLDARLFQQLLETIVRGMVWYTRDDPLSVVDDPLGTVVEAARLNIPQIVVVFGLSLAALALIACLARRMLTWYSLPHAERRLMRLILTMIGGVTVILALVVLPPLTDLVLWRFGERFALASPSYWLLAGLTLLFVVAGAACLLVLDRRHAHVCPACHAKTGGDFRLGARCGTCGALLHPWLGACYRSPQPQAPPRRRAE